MAHQLKLKFDANQQFQLDAVESVVRLFDGLSYHVADFSLGGDIVPNRPPFESFNEGWLFGNLRAVQAENKIQLEQMPLQLEMDNGMPLEGLGYETVSYPSFTIEMETGTGKTYVYLRTIHELRKKYGFSKFIIVVPSIAIYEGVIKNFQITRNHFRAIYGNETVNLIQYDGSRVSQLRSFASSTFVEILVITLDAFNKASNNIYKASEKLPGERLPYQFIQETRPILILDEPQNMESSKSLEALRTLNPLFALRYSATHRTNPNLVYRLTPFDAYRLNLVKKIQVFGVTERENFNQPFLALQEVTITGGIKARLKTYIEDKGHLREADVLLKDKDDLYDKTKREEHKAGYKVIEINAAQNFIEFENGIRLHARETIGPSRPEIFRVQIRKTIEQHMEMQQHLKRKDIKVLSLFFIDRVANYTAPEGIIRRIFDEEFEKLRRLYPFYQDFQPQDVREAYFAKSKPKKGEAEGEALDTPEEEKDKTKEHKELEKVAFELIMKKKEQLLSFDEKKCFIFAHSALKEGWDNPNVFQICTLNQTTSEVKKRQEIGRGLRLAVNQSGDRVFEDDVNVLSVIANQSYKSYAENLQSEYQKTGDAPPPPPRDAARRPAKRNEEIFAQQAFRDFWANLQRRTRYSIKVDTTELILTCINRINKQPTPQAVIVIEKGAFAVTQFTFELESISAGKCRIKITKSEIDGDESVSTLTLREKDDISIKLRDDRLGGFKVNRIIDDGDASKIEFSSRVALDKYKPLIYQAQSDRLEGQREIIAAKEKYPIFNLLDRAAKETRLTRPTINQIFKGLSDRKKDSIFDNPEGFAGTFITEINNALADHVAERIEFYIDDMVLDSKYDLDELFPVQKVFPQKELLDAGKGSLYDQVQIDSDVEMHFVQNYLRKDEQSGKVLFYFKFPPTFKIHLPKVIGNYNPDWGIARYTEDGKLVLELVRETKGGEELEKLRFPHEKRKIICAKKHFKSIGVDYRVLSPDSFHDWWKSEDDLPVQFRFSV